MIQSKFFKKCLAVFLAFFLVFSSAPGWHNFSFAVSGTINFSGVDMSETGDTVTDGQTGSVAASDIPGIDIDIFGSTDKTTKVGKFIYLDFQNVITPSDVPTYTYNYIVIQSRDGSNFNLQSIYINNCNMMEDAVFVEGVRDGVTQGTVNLTLDAGGNPSQFNSSNGLSASIFQNVDKVLISSNTVSSTDITAGIGGIQIGDAVQPTVSLSADTTNNSVDNDLEITFTPNGTFEGNITGITYDGNALLNNQYSVSSGKVTLKPSVADNDYLRRPKTANVVIAADGYGPSTVSQTIVAGTVASMEMATQPVPGANSGLAFGTQPSVNLLDQYGNLCSTGVSSTANVVASAKSGTGSWTIGGTTTKAAVAGVASFTDLSHTLVSVGNGSITFTSGIITTDSQSFNLPENTGKTLTADSTNNDVDNDIEITFVADATFESNITGITFDGNVLTSNQYNISSGKVTLKPSVADNAYLRTPKAANVVVTATGYGDSTVSQTLLAGSVASLEMVTQPVPGANSGSTFATQPSVRLLDQYGNLCATGVSSTANLVASAKNGTGSWTIGGTTTQAAVSGISTFTDLSHTMVSAGNGSITFTNGAITTDSQTFNIPQNAGKILTPDTTNNDVDNDLEITFPADATFEGNITSVSFDGNGLTSNQYTVSSGKVTLKPSAVDNNFLRTPKTANVVIIATDYENSTISQTINAGEVTTLEVSTQPVAGASNGSNFATQPVVHLKDQYGNLCVTGVSATSNVVASVKNGTGSWTIGGTTTKSAISGVSTFTDLSHTLVSAGNGSITFTSGGVTIESQTFNIPENAAKILTADTTNNDVDHDIEITFAPDATFESEITGVTFDGHALTTNQYTISSGKVTLKPSASDNTYLRTPLTADVVILANTYGDSVISQTISAGAVASLEIVTQPVTASYSGSMFITQPIVRLLDQYNNVCSNGPSSTANVVASAKNGTGSWTIGGTTLKPAVLGTVMFTDLTHTLVTAGTGSITFTSGGQTVDSPLFSIPQFSAKTLTADTTNNSVDYDLEITFPADTSFENAITSVSYDGHVLNSSQYTISSGKLTLKPSVSDNVYLRTAGSAEVVIKATLYEDSIVTQVIGVGELHHMNLTQNVLAPTSMGGLFTQQPVVALVDQYDNVVISDHTTVVNVAKEDVGNWTLTGQDTVTANAGIATFTDLGINNAQPISNAQLNFTTTGLTKLLSNSVNLPGPKEEDSTEPVDASDNATSKDETAVVIVNGIEQKTGVVTKTSENGQSVITVVVDAKSVEKQIEAAVKNGNTSTQNRFQIPISDTTSDLVKVALTGDIVKQLENSTFDVSVKQGNIEYVIPANEFTISNVAKTLGKKEATLNEIEVIVKIDKVDEGTRVFLGNAVKSNGAELVFEPIAFDVVAQGTDENGQNQSIEINQFTSYVERIMEIDSSINPSKITTGIVFNDDGSYTHVPTEVFTENGKWYAKVNSKTNSKYSVIWNPVVVSSAKNHWVEKSVNDLASRLVVTNYEAFSPNERITRGAFTDYLVRALGLHRDSFKETTSFIDVPSSHPYAEAIAYAKSYGLVVGTPNGHFKPDDGMTREEAMVILSRAMTFVQYQPSQKLNSPVFSDVNTVSLWAKQKIQPVLEAQLISGVRSNRLAPQKQVTQAEGVQMIHMLLVKSSLINQ